MTGKTLSVAVGWNTTVVKVKERIQVLDGTPAHLQQLTYNGKEKADNDICFLSPGKHFISNGSAQRRSR